MSRRESAPPRRALSVLRRVLPADVRADILADLEELYQLREERDGPARARRWYRAQVLSYALRFGTDGMRRRFRRDTGVPRGGLFSAVSWLDWKLGARMLVKHPALTIIGGFALTAAITIGSIGMEVAGELLYKRLPFDEGERVVRIETRDLAGSRGESRMLYDFAIWRQSLKTVAELGAARLGERNVLTGEGRLEALRVAEITASAFPLTRVAPLLGRPLQPADELPGAEPVVVLSYETWQRHFLGDAAIIGRVVSVGRTQSTVVGVMPPRFGFPRNEQLWLPLLMQDAAPREGPPLLVFGRLAADATWEAAATELDVVNARITADNPDTHAQLRTRVRAYAGRTPGDPINPEEDLLVHFIVLLVLGAVCANVATLIFARTAMRESEIVVRNALGASRQRVIAQIVTESLVLALVAAVLGLVLAQTIVRYGGARTSLGIDEGLPFWVDLTLEPATVVYALLLAAVASVLIGVLPALKATGTSVQRGLQGLTSAGTAMKFGGVWSFIIGAQIAFTLICLPAAAGISREMLRDTSTRSEFPAERFLTFRLSMDGDAAPGEHRVPDDAEIGARRARAYEELAERLRGEPGVTHVTFGDRLPAMSPDFMRAEVQQGSEPPVVLQGNYDGYIGIAAVGTDYHDAFGAELVAGRALHSGDAGSPNRPVLVNEAFMREVGSNPVGARVRLLARRDGEPGPWHEIVGVTRDLGMDPTDRGEAEFMYRAVSAAELDPLIVAVRVAGEAALMAPRLDVLARTVDAGLQIRGIRTLEDVIRERQMPMIIGAGIFGSVLLIALIFSAAGLYALMSVAVERRTREIGIRVALGANPGRVLRTVFARAARQLGGGIIAGNAIILLIAWRGGGGVDREVFLALGVVSLIMAAVGVLACAAPARRALRVQPTEALRQG